MTTYFLDLYGNDVSAYYQIEADTPEQALDLARGLSPEQLAQLDFEPYDLSIKIDCITVATALGTRLAEWQSDDRRLWLAARDLLDALKVALQRLNNYAGEEAAHIATIKAAIAKAEPSDG
jgi:hypothetical protein